MREPLLDSSNTPRARPSRPEQPRERIDPVELARWLRQHEERLKRRWLAGVAGRHGELHDDVRDLLEEFFGLLVRFLSVFLGPYREQVEPLWTQLAELYGSASAMRGLAAGEVIEEFQLLREEVVRLFYDEPPVRRLDHLALRDVLRVNRIVDLGVTHASVGHTDALFFALFQGSGVPNSLTDRQRDELRDQLGSIGGEFREVLAHLRES